MNPFGRFGTCYSAFSTMAVAIAALTNVCAGCGAQAAQQDAARASYATELQLCVADAGSRAAADACRAAVDARYGVDAGLLGAK